MTVGTIWQRRRRRIWQKKLNRLVSLSSNWKNGSPTELQVKLYGHGTACIRKQTKGCRVRFDGSFTEVNATLTIKDYRHAPKWSWHGILRPWGIRWSWTFSPITKKSSSWYLRLAKIIIDYNRRYIEVLQLNNMWMSHQDIGTPSATATRLIEVPFLFPRADKNKQTMLFIVRPPDVKVLVFNPRESWSITLDKIVGSIISGLITIGEERIVALTGKFWASLRATSWWMRRTDPLVQFFQRLKFQLFFSTFSIQTSVRYLQILSKVPGIQLS